MICWDGMCTRVERRRTHSTLLHFHRACCACRCCLKYVAAVRARVGAASAASPLGLGWYLNERLVVGKERTLVATAPSRAVRVRATFALALHEPRCLEWWSYRYPRSRTAAARQRFIAHIHARTPLRPVRRGCFDQRLPSASVATRRNIQRVDAAVCSALAGVDCVCGTELDAPRCSGQSVILHMSMRPHFSTASYTECLSRALPRIQDSDQHSAWVRAGVEAASAAKTGSGCGMLGEQSQ